MRTTTRTPWLSPGLSQLSNDPAKPVNHIVLLTRCAYSRLGTNDSRPATMGAGNEVCVPAQALGGVGNAWIKPGCTVIRLLAGLPAGKPLMAPYLADPRQV